MQKDERYDMLLELVQNQTIKEFNAIYKFIPRSVVAIDLNINTSRMGAYEANPGKFTTDHLFLLEKLSRISFDTLGKLIKAQKEKHHPKHQGTKSNKTKAFK